MGCVTKSKHLPSDLISLTHKSGTRKV